MTGVKDRRELVRASTQWNGIDFIEITDDDQCTLAIHFLNDVVVAVSDFKNVTITGGESIPVVPVTGVGSFNTATKTMVIQVAVPGDFSLYTLALAAPNIDPYFSKVKFTFKARCKSVWGIEPSAPKAGKAGVKAPPIDYLAKDFLSFRKALMDFSSTRYADWKERSEADFGVMFLEALAALADDLSYFQDRVAAEAFFDNATERRSIVRHARLIDYEPRPATAARVLLRLDVGSDGKMPPHVRLTAQEPEGTTIDFETGEGLFDASGGYTVYQAWNAITPYYWDEEEQVLEAGSTGVWVVDDEHYTLATTASLVGRQVLLEQKNPADPQETPLRALVKIVSAVTGIDEIDQDSPVYLTRITWESEEAPAEAFDLKQTEIYANLVPATQGRTVVERFVIEGDGTEEWTVNSLPFALARLGPAVPVGEEEQPGDRYLWGAGSLPQYLYPFRQGPLAWLATQGDDGRPRPEVRLDSMRFDSTTKLWSFREAWTFRRWLLDSTPGEPAFTVDPVAYRALAPVRRDGTVFADYDGQGDTLRFGDGQFGLIPGPGTGFSVTYRVGGGARGNVAAGAISRIEVSPGAPSVTLVTNPFAAEGGADQESNEEVRRLAPEAFRSDQRRAVVPADYEAAARKLSWVQRAGTTFRWTGSYPVVFTTVDPQGAQEISPARFTEVSSVLDRARLSGYASYVRQPRFVSLDLSIFVRAQEGAIRSEVQEAILDALCSGARKDGVFGFFHPDRFTFGQSLERSAIDAAIHAVPGVLGVLLVRYRERGRNKDWQLFSNFFKIGSDEIIRVDNDPNRPERGTIRVEVEGGQ